MTSVRDQEGPRAGASRPVSAVYLATHKYDMRLTRICVASIRYWYPDLPIYLIKDRVAGDFSTEEIERAWNVKIFETEATKFGWGFAKLEPPLVLGGERILVMDVDIAFVGRVIDVLAERSEDIIVQREDQPADPSGRFEELYFSLPGLLSYDPDFRFPRFSFNTGQFVITMGLLRREDFDGLIDWGNPRSVIRPEIFNKSDQGVLNYIVMKKHAAGSLSVARIDFMVWNPAEMARFDISRIRHDSPYQKLIHWAGLRRENMADMPRSDILRKFEEVYYSKVPAGRARMRARLYAERVANLKSKIVARLTRKHPRLYLT